MEHIVLIVAIIDVGDIAWCMNWEVVIANHLYPWAPDRSSFRHLHGDRCAECLPATSWCKASQNGWKWGVEEIWSFCRLNGEGKVDYNHCHAVMLPGSCTSGRVGGREVYLSVVASCTYICLWFDIQLDFRFSLIARIGLSMDIK